MAAESSNRAIPVLVHLIAIAVGVYLGFLVMDRLSPDLPDPDVEPGVSATAPGSVSGDDPNSLFRAPNLARALGQLDDQMGAGQGISRLRIEPGSLDARTTSADGTFTPGDVPVDVPALLVSEIAERRSGIGFGSVARFDLVATAKGPRWYVQLDIDQDIGPPPWTFGAPLDGAPLTAGGAPPRPVG